MSCHDLQRTGRKNVFSVIVHITGNFPTLFSLNNHWVARRGANLSKPITAMLLKSGST